MTYPRLRATLCADWSKDPRHREVYLADVAQRAIRRLTVRGTWTAASVVAAARQAAGDGAALATFDAAVGVPASFWHKLRQAPGFPETATHFGAWLPETLKYTHWFDNARTPRDWRVERPFFAIAPGPGGRRVWENALERAGVETLRRIDELTHANPVFITAGIPGTVGSGTRVLWRELSALLRRPEEPPFYRHPEGVQQKARPKDLPGPSRNSLALWPFAGTLDQLLAEAQVVVAEIYPRTAYALALSAEPAATRAPLKIAKSRRDVRQSALGDLLSHPWINEHRVQVKDLDPAADTETAFDALLTAAGLLRCILEDTPLASDDLTDPIAEGGILGTGSLDLTLSETTYNPKPTRPPRKRRSERRRTPPPDLTPRLSGAPRAPQAPPEPVFHCPIPGCDHVFTGSRAGWDAHVASVRIHPRWQPEARDPAERKALFKDRFRRFFL